MFRNGILSAKVLCAKELLADVLGVKVIVKHVLIILSEGMR